MAIRLKDIPDQPVTPDEIEALANKTFDFADRENVSMRAANAAIKQETFDEMTRNSLKAANKFFGTNFDTSNPNWDPGTIGAGYGDFTLGEKSLEVLKSGHRGLGSLVKIPGIALKAIGETAMTRKEIDDLKNSQSAFQRYRGTGQESPIGESKRTALDFLRRAGNGYINKVNGMTFAESDESRAVRSQPFSAAPGFRIASAIAESGPSYGTAITATLTTGNPNLGLYILGATTSSSAYESYRQQGVDPDLALLGAAIEGSIEIITEKVPMDMLMKGVGRNFVDRALRIGTAESFQELFAQLGQNYTAAVIKDVDPENFATALKAADQEWAIISQGWQDAMGAGFFMGGGAGLISSGQGGQDVPDFGFRNDVQMKAQYGVSPRNMNEMLYLHEQIKNKVREVAKVAEKAAEPSIEVDAIAEDVTLTPEEQSAVDVQVESGTDEAEAIRLTRLATEGLKQADAAIEAGITEPSELEKVNVQVEAEQARVEVPEAKPAEQKVAIDPVVETILQRIEEIGEGEEKVRGSASRIMAKAIEKEFVELNKDLEGSLPIYRTMNMQEQAEKALLVIEEDVEKAKRIAFYEESAPPGLYPENMYAALSVYATLNVDTDLLRDLALNENAVREHTILGKQVKSLDTGQDSANPVAAIKDISEARKEKIVRDGKDLAPIEAQLRELQLELDVAKKALADHVAKANRAYGTRNKVVSRTEYDQIIARRGQEIAKLRHGRNLGAAYIPNAQDFIDMAKISSFHLEAIGRDFATWSVQVTKDLGEWVTPHLKGQYDKAIKEVGESIPQRRQASPEIKAKSALKAYKTRLKNQIGELTAQIESGKRIARAKKSLLLDEEAKRLKTERDALQVVFDKVFGKKKVSDEKRVEIATKAVEKSIASLEEKIKRGDTSVKKRKKLSTPAIDALRARRDELNKDLKRLRDAEKPKKSPEEIKLQAKKSRLKTGAKKFEAKLGALDFEKAERAAIELDVEGQKLQDAFDLARSKFKAAQAAADIITEDEVRIIGELAKNIAERKAKMETGKRRNNAKHEAPTKVEIDYGTALFMFNEYTGGLKGQANKKTLKQKAVNYLQNPVDILTDTFGIMKNLRATWDNSFIGRQGRRTFLKGLTGDMESARIWWRTFFRSFKIMWDTLKGRNVKRALFAEIVSDPDYDLLKQSKVAINVGIEEEIATDILERIPYLGMTFKVSDNAFIESSRYMRYRLAKQYIDIWRKSGRVIDKKQALSLGKLANSQTGRGEGASTGLLNNVFWSPGNLRANIDTLTLHLFDRNFSAFARKQAALNLMRYISGAAMILALADWIDEDSVTWDPTSSDFGKIKVGKTRFSVGGGLEILIVLASRLVSRQFTSATSGRKRDIDAGSFFQTGGKDLVFNFFENKFSPGLSMALTIVDQKSRDGDSLSIPQMSKEGLSPLIVQSVMESGDVEDSANILAVLMAEAFGVNVQTFKDRKGKPSGIPKTF